MMPQSDPDTRPVTLQEVLDCKERRVQLQQQLLAQFRLPVVSLTMVTPGAIKNTETSRFLFQAALGALKDLSKKSQWRIVEGVETICVTGAEAVFAVDAVAGNLKPALVEIEDTHPLGRLWDFDVIDQPYEPLSRSHFGLSSRKCLMCDEPAFACGRSRRHAVEELIATIEDKVRAFRCS